MKQTLFSLAITLILVPALVCAASAAPEADDPSPPADTVKLIFIHHSCGSNWLNDSNGGLGIALRDNNYFVSDTNYGWGPDGIGDNTDIGHWWTWFRGASSSTYLNALYTESGQHASYSRLGTDPGGENEIVMFKSCYPNSNLRGGPDDPPTVGDNPLRGQACCGEDHNVANAKGIYNDLLTYFATRQDKLFVVITAPPVQDDTWAANARAFNTWLVEDWLAGYPYNNVAVWDFYNVLTSNGGDWSTNDLSWETGNHHRWWNGVVQYVTDQGGDTAAYPDGGSDNHPSPAGNQKATAEFVDVLNVFYNRWTSPTSVTLASWSATVHQDRVLLTWETATEVDNLGFRVYRADADGTTPTQINDGLIPSQVPGSPTGAIYTYQDDQVRPGQIYHYWLEDVDVHGGATRHGPLRVTLPLGWRLVPARPRTAASHRIGPAMGDR